MSDKLVVDLQKFPTFRRLENDKAEPSLQRGPEENISAALVATMAEHGKKVSVDEVFAVVQRQADPTSQAAIIEAARVFNFVARRIVVPASDLRFLRPGSWLRTIKGDYVVVKKATDRRIQVFSPRQGRLSYTTEECEKELEPIAFEFEPRQEVDGRLTHVGRAVLMLLFQHRPLVMRLVGLAFALQFFAFTAPLLSALIIERVLPKAESDLIPVIAIGLVVVVAIQTVLELIKSLIALSLRVTFSWQLNREFISHLVDLPHSYLSRHGRGDILLRAQSNEKMLEVFGHKLIDVGIDVFSALLALAVMIVASPAMALMVVGFAILQVSVLVYSRRRLVPLADEIFEARGKLSSTTMELIDASDLLKSMGLEERAIRHWSARFVDALELTQKQGRIQAAAGSANHLLSAGIPLILLVFGASLVVEGAMSLGVMVAMLSVATSFLAPMSSTAAFVMELQVLSSIIERVNEVRQHATEQIPGEVARAPRLKGGIQVENVSFHYSADAPVLRDISIDIRPGEFVAIVGPSGSGKTTLASILVGMQNPTKGRVLYDGLELSAIDLRGVRRQVGSVLQESFLMGGISLRDNIVLGASVASFDRVIHSAQIACIHNEILAMPMGYETMASGSGGGFSGGQKQRISIARAIVGDPSILIFDEATSSLDQRTEQRLQNNLFELERTKIVVAHRLATIRRADRILVLDGGRIVQQGSHEELLSAPDGLYARMVAANVES